MQTGQVSKLFQLLTGVLQLDQQHAGCVNIAGWIDCEGWLRYCRE
jgi:hypothetical protein